MGRSWPPSTTTLSPSTDRFSWLAGGGLGAWSPRVLVSRSVPTLVALFGLVTGLCTLMALFDLIRTIVLNRAAHQLDQALVAPAFRRWIAGGVSGAGARGRAISDSRNDPPSHRHNLSCGNRQVRAYIVENAVLGSRTFEHRLRHCQTPNVVTGKPSFAPERIAPWGRSGSIRRSGWFSGLSRRQSCWQARDSPDIRSRLRKGPIRRIQPDLFQRILPNLAKRIARWRGHGTTINLTFRIDVNIVASPCNALQVKGLLILKLRNFLREEKCWDLADPGFPMMPFTLQIFAEFLPSAGRK